MSHIAVSMMLIAVSMATAAAAPASAGVAAVPSTPRTTAAADPRRGQQLYEARCGACHSLDANGAGPRHRGVVGRRVASLPDYQYSAALARKKFVWDAARLDRWLADPNAYVPGNKMVVRLADDPRDRRDLIAYLTAN